MIHAQPVSGADNRHIADGMPRQRLIRRRLLWWFAGTLSLIQGIALAAAPNSVDVWNVEGAGHTSGLATAPTEWEYRVIGFLDQAVGD